MRHSFLYHIACIPANSLAVHSMAVSTALHIQFVMAWFMGMNCCDQQHMSYPASFLRLTGLVCFQRQCLYAYKDCLLCR